MAIRVHGLPGIPQPNPARIAADRRRRDRIAEGRRAARERLQSKVTDIVDLTSRVINAAVQSAGEGKYALVLPAQEGVTEVMDERGRRVARAIDRLTYFGHERERIHTLYGSLPKPHFFHHEGDQVSLSAKSTRHSDGSTTYGVVYRIGNFELGQYDGAATFQLVESLLPKVETESTRSPHKER